MSIDAEALTRLRVAVDGCVGSLNRTGHPIGAAQLIIGHGNELSALLDIAEAVALANTPWRCECGCPATMAVMDQHHNILSKSCAGCGRSLIEPAPRPTPEGAE